jgi:hypothetical protein
MRPIAAALLLALAPAAVCAKEGIPGKEGLWNVVARDRARITIFFTAGTSKERCDKQAGAFLDANRLKLAPDRGARIIAVVSQSEEEWRRGCTVAFELKPPK